MTRNAERTPWLPLGLTFLLIALIAAVAAWYQLRFALAAERVRFHITGLSAEAADKVDIVAFDQDFHSRVALRHETTFYWHVDSLLWIRKLLLKIPANELRNLKSFTISVGDETYPPYGAGDAADWPREDRANVPPDKAGPDDLVLIVPVQGRSTSLPLVRSLLQLRPGETLLNWPGDGSFLHTVGQYALFPAFLVVLVCFYCMKSRTLEFASATPQAAVLDSPIWNWLGLLFLAGALTFLEVRDPYYFTECDTLTECFPMILFGCRSLWDGVFPSYNPYLFMGSPLANLGIYGLTYPPLLASYALARHVLNNEYATIEVFAIGHLLAGFLLTRRLARRIGMSALPANLAALSFVLSGASLIMGRSWFNFIPLVVWTPVLFLGLVRLRERPVGWLWTLGMGLAMGLPIHVGFSQVAIYINGFFCLAVAYWMMCGALSWRRALSVLPALAIGAAVAVPLVWQQFLFYHGATPRASSNDGIGLGLPAMLLPYPLVKTQVPPHWGNDHLEVMGQFYYFGCLLSVLFFFQAIGLFFFRCWRSRQGNKETKSQGEISSSITLSPRHLVTLSSSLWTFCGLIALWLSMGSAAGLWRLLSMAPVLGSINRHPFRLMPFVVFFAVLAGGLVLERLLRRARNASCIGVALFVLADLGLHVGLCRTAFHIDNYHPYPELPADLRALLWNPEEPVDENAELPRFSPLAAQPTRVKGRIFSFGRHSFNDTYPLTMPKNLPDVYEMPTTEGTNPLIEQKPEFLDIRRHLRESRVPALRAFGVRWFLEQAPDKKTPDSTAASGSWLVEVYTGKDSLTSRKSPGWQSWHDHPEPLEPVFEKDGVVVRELAPVDPLAFPADNNSWSLPIALHGRGLDVKVDTVAANRDVVVNFLQIADMQAYLDGAPVPFSYPADPWGRIKVKMPRTGEMLSIRYQPSWATGLWIALAVLVLGIGGAAVCGRMKEEGARSGSKGMPC